MLVNVYITTYPCLDDLIFLLSVMGICYVTPTLLPAPLSNNIGLVLDLGNVVISVGASVGTNDAGITVDNRVLCIVRV